MIFVYRHNSTTNDNTEQSTSSSNEERIMNLKLCTFDDFVPLQRIKAQYKGHRNSRYLNKTVI